MAIKTVGNRLNFQQRQEIKRFIQMPGIGRVFSNDPQRRLKELQKRIDSLSQQYTPQQIDPARQAELNALIQQENDFNTRAAQGKINYGEFTETTLYKDLIQQYGPNLGQDIGQIVYYNYLEQYRPLSKNELYARANVTQTARSKLKVQGIRELLSTSAGRAEYQEGLRSSKEFRRQLAEANRQGFVLGENFKLIEKPQRSSGQPLSIFQKSRFDLFFRRRK